MADASCEVPKLVSSRTERSSTLPTASGSHPELLSPWGRVRSRFLTSLGNADRMRIYDLALQTATALHAWAEPHPAIRSIRIPPLCLSVAAAAPFCSVEALLSTARTSLWVFTLDDWFDEERAPEVELRRNGRDFWAIARGRQPVGQKHNCLAPLLTELRADLSGYPLFDVLADEWTAALGGTVDAMMREYEWRAAYRHPDARSTATPTYGDYLRVGRYSIGGPVHMWTAMITINDPSIPDHLDHLRAMEELASTCIRLANDLRSYDKEILEGNVNAPVILSRELMADGMTAEAALASAEKRVRGEIRARLERLSQLRHGAVTDTGQAEAAVENIARFVCDFYAHHDYHTFVGAAA